MILIAILDVKSDIVVIFRMLEPSTVASEQAVIGNCAWDEISVLDSASLLAAVWDRHERPVVAVSRH